MTVFAELKEIFAAAFSGSQVVDGTSTQESMLKCALKTCSCTTYHVTSSLNRLSVNFLVLSVFVLLV